MTDQAQELAFGKAGDGFVEAFAKGLAVICAFNGEKRALSMADVAERDRKSTRLNSSH